MKKSFCCPILKTGKSWPHLYTLALVAVGWALFVGNEPGVGLGLLFQKLFIPSGGVSCLYFLRNYGVILLVAIVCCTPLPIRFYEWLKKHTALKILVVFALLLLSITYIVASTNSPFLYFRF